ncbi:MAG: hypothetical protein M3N43_06540 [Actinomycetota bacterium]|nr:hypothetical protein [Actinomycetota bacterium]
MICECTCDTAGMFYMCNAHKAVVDAARAWVEYITEGSGDDGGKFVRLLDAVRALDNPTG